MAPAGAMPGSGDGASGGWKAGSPASTGGGVGGGAASGGPGAPRSPTAQAAMRPQNAARARLLIGLLPTLNHVALTSPVRRDRSQDPMRSKAVRSTFLNFFAQHGHEVVRSSSLIPANDPTLLFTNA